MEQTGKNEQKSSKRQNYRGMAKLILMKIIPILVVIVFAIFTIIYVNINVSYSKQIVDRMNGECQSVTNKVQVWSNEALAVLNTLADQVGNGYLGDNENIIAYMQECQETLISGSDGFYVIYNDENGTTLSYDGEESFPDYLTEDWFKFGLAADKATFNECSFYTEDGTNEYTVTCAKNIKDTDGNVIGMTATDLKFSTIRDTIAEESSKLNADFVLIDNKSGMIIASSNSDYEGVTKEDATDQFLINILDQFDTAAQNKTIKTVKGKYVLTISNVEDTEWYLVLYEDYNSAYGTLIRVLI
ncbi:MAG: cache domain-containing protein, partial [Lachnospiraceae bacterium]|nr:cache domain-containing protein [Lachnospiraceae bacterium]